MATKKQQSRREDRHNHHTVRNIAYFAKLMWRASPALFLLTFARYFTARPLSVLAFVYVPQRMFAAIYDGTSFYDLIPLMVAGALVFGLRHVISALHEWVMKLKSANLIREIYLSVIDVSVKLDYEKFEQPDFYDRYSRALGQTYSVAFGVIQDTAGLFGNIIGSVMAFSVVASVDPVLLLFIIPVVVIMILLGVKIPREYFALNKEETRSSRAAAYAKRVFYEKKYAAELRLYNIKDVLLKNHEAATEELSKVNKKYRRRIAVMTFMADYGIVLFCTIGPLFYAAAVVLGDASLNLGEYVAAAISGMGFASGSLAQAGSTLTVLGQQAVLLDNYMQFVHTQETDYSDRAKAEEPLGDIAFDNVSFVYNGAAEPVLKNLSFKIKKGERIAFVGHNGAGKTTLVKLLMGLYGTSAGTITVSGRDIQSYEPRSYRSHFGTVFQDLQVFSLKISENILMKSPETEAERLLAESALEKAQFVSAELPQGIDSMATREFDEKGTVLSGGQAQKIAIARVFAKNPDIVILDEPSSALDPISEYNMYENMLSLPADKTLIFISHRLSSARVADRIYMLEQGEIIETGSHDELMAQNGKYAEMFNLQARNYLDLDDTDDAEADHV
jgi:ATP-binding cassette subfamily B protein